MAGELEITFLGTGTSTGVPVIACDCDVCRSTDPRDRRDRCSIYVSTAEGSWVVDTGPDFRHQCLRENIRSLDAVLITHAHTDHIMGFDDLRRFTFGEDETLPVYAAPETLAALRRIFGFAFDAAARYPGYLKADAVEATGPFMLGGTEITPVPVEHGSMTTRGWLFSRAGRRLAAYLPDCKEVPAASRDLLRGTDTLIIDALRPREHPTHMSFDEALELVADCGAACAWFTHFSHEVKHAELEAMFPPHVRPAWDGLKLKIG